MPKPLQSHTNSRNMEYPDSGDIDNSDCLQISYGKDYFQEYLMLLMYNRYFMDASNYQRQMIEESENCLPYEQLRCTLPCCSSQRKYQILHDDTEVPQVPVVNHQGANWTSTTNSISDNIASPASSSSHTDIIRSDTELPDHPHQLSDSKDVLNVNYTCPDCGKCFKRSSSLSNHRLIHKNVKAYMCDKCGRSFLRKSDLGKHQTVHTGIKMYCCDFCGRRFSQSSNMRTHRRRHLGIRLHECLECGKTFYRKVDVRRHYKVHNINKIEPIKNLQDVQKNLTKKTVEIFS